MTSMPSPFPFLSLPLELREAIYSLYFKPADRLAHNLSLDAQGYSGGVYDFDFDLYLVNRQLYDEAKTVWRRENVFVKIATPWPSAEEYNVNHISSEGLVPIVCKDRQADGFNSHHALIQITAPFHQATPEHCVVVLLDDLHLFAQTWYYSALSYPMLNDRLSTIFVLRDPYSPNPGSPNLNNPNIPLQRRIILPFGQIKGLYHKELLNFAPTIHQELSKEMSTPVPTLQQSCESCADLIDQGDAILPASPAAALDLYMQAFHAIHILVHKRTRRVLADVFFHETIEAGRFAGQTGLTVRVVLRLQLVSRCLLAYLRLGQWDEAAFWGMRTIRIMRQSMDVDYESFLSEFIGGSDISLIYVRCGIGFWKMEGARGEWGGELEKYVGEEAGSNINVGLCSVSITLALVTVFLASELKHVFPILTFPHPVPAFKYACAILCAAFPNTLRPIAGLVGVQVAEKGDWDIYSGDQNTMEE
ncbi:hypothetical protein GQ44DRAFT_728400 [Phaeosphaeriaceae sp. PMI808]|nr:hypothetical protein GQ44DRAFT_728400 [Phaeosphaeriaceae sp. PMI808]